MNITLQRLAPTPSAYTQEELRLAHWLQIAATGQRSNPIKHIYLAQAHAIATQRKLARELAKSLIATMEYSA